MIPRIYAVPFENVSVTATQDFFEISPADDKPCAIIAGSIDFVGGAADVGDAQEELLRLAVVRGHTTSGSAGSTPTPVPLVSTDTAAGFTAEVNNTTIASAGTAVTIWPFGVNNRIGREWSWPQEQWITCPQGILTVVRLLAAPADALAMSGCLWVAEFG